jgi:hypothetical protein
MMYQLRSFFILEINKKKTGELFMVVKNIFLNYEKECLKFFVYLFALVSFMNFLNRDFENFKAVFYYIKSFFIFILIQ